MKRIILASVLLSTGGCAGRVATPETTPVAVAEPQAPPEPDPEALAALRTERESQQREIRRLEAQLALARAEQERARSAGVRTETVRIGDGIPGSPNDDLFDDDDWSESEEAEEPPSPIDRGPRPVLRLYGSSAAPIEGPGEAQRPGADGSPASPVVIPAAPPGISMHLPVSALPPDEGATASQARSPDPSSLATSASSPSPQDPAVADYRRALGLVRDRDLVHALAAMERFEREHPHHPYALNALYWQAEVLYMQRRYPEALRRFEVVVQRQGRGSKVPDALLKIGLCYERMGDLQRARAYFQRVRAEYPNSVAARSVSREDAS